MIFTDYSKEIQTLRNTFLAAKRKLRQMDLTYAMIYPTRLRVLSQGVTLFFNTHQEVWSWIERQPVQDLQETQTWQMPRAQRIKRKKGRPLESPPTAEEVKQAGTRCQALADVMAFGKEDQVRPTPSGENPVDREENNEIAMSNGTTWSELSDLSDSKLDLPIVTPRTRTADDLLCDQQTRRLQHSCIWFT
ncbi:hypothetical protein NDU88_005766 [Pleurodeles waltl]|uniref:Uncharacterized protein n=1 Tax=Pleurodeles waltl TaxID=8319 RepID=A0AAV7L1T6_PLEWA|nr:hypothetical protein NDU88_005766 [Pleurodeles waltl]